MNATEYFAQMCKEAGLDDESTSALAKLANNEKLSPKLAALVKTATEDYPAQLGRVRAAEEKVSKYDAWYPTAKQAADAALQRTAEVEAELARVRSGGMPPEFDPSKYVSKEDLMKFNTDMAGRFAGVIKDATSIAARHASKFGEEPDLNAIEKIAAEQNLPLQAAYDRWIEPRVEAKRKEDFDTKLKQAREEGARDALSRHKLPVDATPQETAPMFMQRPKEGAAPVDIDSELLSAWNSAGKSASQ